MPQSQSADLQAIRTVICDQFTSLNWTDERDADWAKFSSCFTELAVLFPAKRPVQPQSPGAFADRMRGLSADNTLKSFSEQLVGCEAFFVGNVAVALAGCEMTENGKQITRDVSAFLLIKNPEGWRIAAQAWDTVDDIAAAFEAAGLHTHRSEV